MEKHSKKYNKHFVSFKLCKELHKLDFDLNTRHYWLKLPQSKTPKLHFIEGEFYHLPTTKVYKSYNLETLLELMQVAAGEFTLQEGWISVAKTYILRLPNESLVDLAARTIIELLKTNQIVKGN